jgi:competence ComEA-like helix-hairpin-helix protein
VLTFPFPSQIQAPLLTTLFQNQLKQIVAPSALMIPITEIDSKLKPIHELFGSDDDFLMNMTREMSVPLTNMKTALRLLDAMQNKREQRQRYLDLLKRECDRQNLLITGSHNWSDAANHLNDETLLVLNNPMINAHYQREFERLYKDAILGVPRFIENAIAQEQQKCALKSTQSVQVPNPVSSQTSSQTTSPSQLINLNTATKEELNSLPGVGPKLSDRILQARQEKPFTSLEDLKRVSGIGESKLRKLAGKVTW